MIIPKTKFKVGDKVLMVSSKNSTYIFQPQKYEIITITIEDIYIDFAFKNKKRLSISYIIRISKEKETQICYEENLHKLSEYSKLEKIIKKNNIIQLNKAKHQSKIAQKKLKNAEEIVDALSK